MIIKTTFRAGVTDEASRPWRDATRSALLALMAREIDSETFLDRMREARDLEDFSLSRIFGSLYIGWDNDDVNLQHSQASWNWGRRFAAWLSTDLQLTKLPPAYERVKLMGILPIWKRMENDYWPFSSIDEWHEYAHLANDLPEKPGALSREASYPRVNPGN